MKKPIEDFDLDVNLALRGFPDDDLNAYIFIRLSKVSEDADADIYIKTFGIGRTITDIFLSAIDGHEPVKNCILDAVLSYFMCHPTEMQRFKEMLELIKKHKDA